MNRILAVEYSTSEYLNTVCKIEHSECFSLVVNCIDCGLVPMFFIVVTDNTLFIRICCLKRAFNVGLLLII